MKKLANLKGVKALSKKEQKTISGGLARGQTCQELFVSADCCDPCWTSPCGFIGAEFCFNGICYI
ncbi:hypothetical protein WIW50_18920 [Flavobacteriaceae bacterium 3-367]